MGDIQVRVMYDNYGNPKGYAGVGVSLGYSGGVSNTRYTDNDGYVHFDALGWWGQVTIYVRGQEVGTYSCRGEADITVTVEV